MNPKDFIAKIAPGAQACMRDTKIPASFTIAQAALESGWGAKAPGNNLFGIKADPSWHGPTVDFSTHEVVAGKSVPLVDKFRAYPDWGACLLDHAKFLTTNKRYAPAFMHSDNAEQFTLAVAAAGYATDPQYATKIIAEIRSRNLMQYDLPA
ncbi:flagellar protein FlgJ [Herbaspirillum sp. Sphag1AN]|uniref:glycoside hydrolase family 73 protein n=1 Tax=unclassified Herbaspirillum TaxID=2624150 RepID=UPI001612DBF0|nr:MULTISPECIES: glycoside hydrolase family 73 protein [unclassified Herbaspirillum]MBB3213410.1 flagellar protein FlgJ [Herbaspirillum sp. Sphag1AN]MBB3246546.1 flagellar protein FlgJ [Herbaspirillum sp. Sphag64]